MRKIPCFAVGLLLIGLSSACGLFALGAPLEKPQVTVSSVALDDVSFTGVRGTLGLHIANPNAVGLPLTAIDWQLAIAGQRAVTGRVELNQEIPAKGSAPVTASLQLATSDAVMVAPLLARGARDYQLNARLSFQTALGVLAVDVQQEGRL